MNFLISSKEMALDEPGLVIACILIGLLSAFIIYLAERNKRNH